MVKLEQQTAFAAIAESAYSYQAHRRVPPICGNIPTGNAGLKHALPDFMEYLHRPLTQRIIAVYHEVYSTLGRGFLERIYHRAMLIALADAGLAATADARFNVSFRGHCLGEFVPDVVVEDRVLLEIKAANTLQPQDEAQLLNYLRASPIEVGLLLNFGAKREIRRRVLTTDRKIVDGPDYPLSLDP